MRIIEKKKVGMKKKLKKEAESYIIATLQTLTSCMMLMIDDDQF